MTYRIRDWDKNFERAQTRSVEKVSWVAIPVKHDGLAYRRLMSRKDGAAIFGAWVLIVQVAAKCPERGVLASDRGPLEAEDLALMTGATVSVMKDALSVLSLPEIGWLERVAPPNSTLSADYQSANSTAQPTIDIKEERRREDKEESRGEDNTEPTASVSTSADIEVLKFPTAGNSREWSLTLQKVHEYQGVYLGIDVQSECRKALQWCRDNPAKRKTAKGMPAFLNRWLEKAQNNGGGTRGHPHRNGVTATIGSYLDKYGGQE